MFTGKPRFVIYMWKCWWSLVSGHAKSFTHTKGQAVISMLVRFPSPLIYKVSRVTSTFHACSVSLFFCLPLQGYNLIWWIWEIVSSELIVLVEGLLGSENISGNWIRLFQTLHVYQAIWKFAVYKQYNSTINYTHFSEQSGINVNEIAT